MQTKSVQEVSDAIKLSADAMTRDPDQRAADEIGTHQAAGGDSLLRLEPGNGPKKWTERRYRGTNPQVDKTRRRAVLAWGREDARNESGQQRERLGPG